MIGSLMGRVTSAVGIVKTGRRTRTQFWFALSLTVRGTAFDMFRRGYAMAHVSIILSNYPLQSLHRQHFIES